MPVPHFNIKITQRSKGKSAVAGAAYQAGEKLFSEYDQKTKNYTCKKEVVYTEIMLPPNAPPEYADRATLWNSVEEIEKQWNSQLARRFVVALPREVPMEMLPQMVKEYCEEHFVSKGMCCDFAIHDPYPPGHNPHCHFMLTMRAIDENGKWLPKSRKVYDLDENGERIKLPSGRWKSHKEDTVDWNEQYHAEEWRHGWEVVQNKYLELAGSPERIDMRSYERQGLDIIPTVHMGTAVSALERKGIATNIGNLNRDIKAANRMMNAIRSTIKNLRDWIADILEATKEVLAENEAEKKNVSPNLATLLRDYLNLRKAERSEWSRYGQQKGTTDDLKTISQATVYLQQHELFTLEDLDTALQGVSDKATSIREDMQKAANRIIAPDSEMLWNAAIVWRILRRYEYTGALVMGRRKKIDVNTTSIRTLPEDKWIIAENAHEAIVTKDEYYQAQKAIRNVTPIQYKVGDDFALKGKICCGNCKRQLRHEKQYGEMVFCCGYKRAAGKFSKCYGGYYREYSVNAKVARAIKTVFYALDVVNQGMQEKQSITVRCMDIEDLEKQAEAIRVEQIKLYELYADGVLLRDAYIEKKKVLSEKLATLQDSIRIEKEEQECADELDEEIRALTKQASEKTYIGGLTKECVDAFVSMVYLYDDQTMKVEFNCEDVIRRALEKYGA